MFEAVSYHFFKRRLRKKLGELYEMEDPWGGAFLSGIFSPLVRTHMQSLPREIRESPVLDAGGGEAPYYPALKDLIPEYHLVDINPAALERAKKATDRAKTKLILKSLDEFRPEPNRYGTLLLIGVLTYLGGAKFPRTVFGILKRLWSGLKPGGIAVLIHPFYGNEESVLLKKYASYFIDLGGTMTYRESRPVGKQHFQIDILTKK